MYAEVIHSLTTGQRCRWILNRMPMVLKPRTRAPAAEHVATARWLRPRRVAGLLYVVVILGGLFAEVGVSQLGHRA